MEASRRSAWWTLSASLALTAALAGGYRLLFLPVYQTNDDVGLSFWSEGVGFCDVPTPYLLFSNYLYGQLLALLNGWAQAVNWYRVCGEAIHALATTVLAWAVLRSDFRLRTAVLLVAHLLAFDLLYWRTPQFTVTAFVAAEAGVFLVFRAIAAGERPGPLTVGAAALLIGIGTLVRGQSAYLVLVLSVPLFCGALLFRPRRGAGAAATFLLTAGVVAGALAGYDHLRYQQVAGWREFGEFNRLRAEFNDYGRVQYDEQTRPIFADVGWSRNDFAMFCGWAFQDRERFSVPRLRTILANAPPRQGWLTHRLRIGIAGMQFGPEGHLMLLVLAASLLAIRWDRRRALWVCATLLGCLCMAAFLLVRMKLPPRVWHPMLGFCNLAALMAAVSPPLGAGFSRWQNWPTALVLVAVLALLPGEFNRARSESQAFQRVNEKWLAALAALDPQPDQLYVCWGAQFPYELLSPDDNLDCVRNLKILPLGTSLRTPTTDARQAQFGITDLYRALYEKENVFLVAGQPSVEAYRTYVREHYGVEVRARPVFSADLGMFRGRDFALRVQKMECVVEPAASRPCGAAPQGPPPASKPRRPA